MTTVVSQAVMAAAAQLAGPPARTTVAASCGSPTTGREPPGQLATAFGAARAGDSGMPTAPAARPTARFANVSVAVRIAELAEWIAAQPNFTFAEAAAANAPTPCSRSTMAHMLPDARLAAALARLGFVVTVGGKNGYTVTPVMARAQGSGPLRPVT